ncbi:diguanylate cyclase [Undibacterium sp. 10I3]|uniref:sensor domain-containing diguanylate cyclase n=1 Tax=Undibacterium sp. 10I3 TaxID=3048579 RepID=UPI002B22DB3C|nr:diguanylate cyclase [Undibacterium sp. 10I3]MEB0230254.1 diguanylate cyclase [Undibacterium sp. 10I3]
MNQSQPNNNARPNADQIDDGNQRVLLLYQACLAEIAKNAPLAETLSLVTHGIEEQCSGLIATVLVLTEYHQLGMVVAPSLSPACVAAISKMTVGMDLLGCRCNVVSAPDIETRADDPCTYTSLFWNNLQVLAAQHELFVSSALPVVNGSGTLIGMIALFAKHSGRISVADHHRISGLSSLVVISIERHHDQRRTIVANEAMRQSEANMSRMALAIEGSATGIWDRHIQTGEIHYSSGWKALLGYTESEISNRIEDSYTRVHPDDLAYVQATIRAHFEGKTDSYAVEHRVRCKNGSYIWVSSRGKIAVRDADGTPLRMIGTTTDITAIHLLSDRLQHSVDLVTNLTNEVPGLAYQYQQLPNGPEHFSYVSEGIKDIYELSPAQITDTVALVHQLIHPDDFGAYRAAIDASAKDLHQLHLEFRVNLPQQGLQWRQMAARPRRLPDGGTLWHGFITDVTERKRLEIELQALATIDFLTQIPNRRYFMGRMAEELARVQRAVGKPSAVLMCDLDHFKSINDRHGHAVGDLVLKHFANILRDELRKSDSAGRVGGEEFAVVLSGTSILDANVFAQRVQKQLHDTPVNANNQIIPITVSIGIAMMSASDTSPDASLSRSDMALYLAKESGRNKITIAAD